MRSKIIFAVIFFFTLGLKMAANCTSTSNEGLCDCYMDCLKPRMDHIFKWRNAMDLFEFDITFSSDGVQTACAISKEMKKCLDTAYDKPCIAGLASFMILSQKLMEETCTLKESIKVDVHCWENTTLHEDLRNCYIEDDPHGLEVCQSNKIVLFGLYNECDGFQMSDVHQDLFRIYERF